MPKPISTLNPTQKSLKKAFKAFFQNLFFMVLAFAILISCQEPQSATETEIFWDEWGIPHIYSNSEEDLFYAFGWAQMNNHANLMLKLYGEARGKAAEYWDENFLPSDEWVLRMGIKERAAQWYKELEPDEKQVFDAFTRGVNAYAEEHRDRIDTSLLQVLPIRGEDILAHFQRVIHFTFIAGEANYQAQQWQQLGSNAMAIAPKKSASGNAMLMSNPHLPWTGFFTWFECHLSAPDIHAYGATLVGFPILGIAFNDRLGWTHTNNTFDGMDLYEVILDKEGYYQLGEERLKPTRKNETLYYLDREEGIQEQVVERIETVHGPVIQSKGDTLLALRVTGLEEGHVIGQYLGMIKAQNLEEFTQEISRLQMPFFNITYADADGHIMYFFGGRNPDRSSGNWADWKKVLDGAEKDLLWNKSLTFEELPKVIDPPTGFVQNANDPPWTSTFPRAIDRRDYPEHISPVNLGFRPLRSLNMLLEKDSISFEDFKKMKHDSYMQLADRILPDLLKAIDQEGSQYLKNLKPILEEWDRTASADSKGAFWFSQWARTMEGKMFKEEWSEENPLETPRKLSDRSLALEVLESEARNIQANFGYVDVPWGKVYRLKIGDYDYPASGGPGELGIFRCIWSAPDGDQSYRSMSGDSYVALVEFGESPRAEALLTYGNASMEDSPHHGDQLKLFSENKLRNVYFNRSEVEENAKVKEVLQQGNWERIHIQ